MRDGEDKGTGNGAARNDRADGAPAPRKAIGKKGGQKVRELIERGKTRT